MERKLKYLWIGNQQTKEPLFNFSWDNVLTDQTYQQLSEILNKENFSSDLKAINSDIDTWYGKATYNFLFMILADQNSELAFMNKIFQKLERLFHGYHYESDLDTSNQLWIRDLWRLKKKYENGNKPETISSINIAEQLDRQLLWEIDIHEPYINTNNLSDMIEYSADRIDRLGRLNRIDVVDEVSETEFYRKRVNDTQNRIWKELIPITIGVVVFLSVLGLMLATAIYLKPENNHEL